MQRLPQALMMLSLLFLVAGRSTALTIDFEEFAHGQIVTSSQGVAISTVNIGGGPNMGVSFDSNLKGTSDQDLQFNSPGISGGKNGWRSGNLAPDTDLGNIMIIQEHTYSCGGFSCSDPDDEGSRPAGYITFDYTAIGTFDQFSMDLIDVEESTQEEPGSIDFYLAGVHVVQVMFSDFGAPEVVYGNNSANHLLVIDGMTFDTVVVSLGGSGGIDNLTATHPVPEPTAAMLFLAGMAMVSTHIRRTQG